LFPQDVTSKPYNAGGHRLQNLTPAEAMDLADDAKVTQSARKDVALHKIRRCELDLEVAKGKVHQCEDTLATLWKEVADAEANLVTLESGMVGIQRLVLEAEQIKASAHADSSGTVDNGSVDSMSRGSDVSEHDTRLAL